MFDYEDTINLESKSIARYPNLIRGWVDRNEWLEAAAGWRSLSERYVHRGLLKWRHGECPIDDLLRGHDAILESDALVEREHVDLERDGLDCDLFARAFALVDLPVEVFPLREEDIAADEVPEYLIYSHFVSLRLQNRSEAEQQRARSQSPGRRSARGGPELSHLSDVAWRHARNQQRR